jgi:cytochrome c
VRRHSTRKNTVKPPGVRRGLRGASRFAVAALALLTAAGMASAEPAPGSAAAADTTVLVFSKTAGFRHDSIPDGIAAIQALGDQNGFDVEATEDATAFTADNLSRFAAVVFLSTTGDVLNDDQQTAFENYINAGGGYAGVHAAADTEYDWPFYGQLVGAWFKSHPAIQQATVDVVDHDHPSTADLPDHWTRTDEWYNYRTNPRANVKVLAQLDETSYAPGPDAMGDHPITWCHAQEQGRSWYTGLGHTKESYTEDNFLSQLKGGIEYAAGLADGDCSPATSNPDDPPTDADFDQITLAKGEEVTGEPMALAVLPDRRVIHTSRDGRIWLTTAAATTSLAGQIPVYNHDEDGLQGVALDPNFAENHWVYFYYAPPLDTPAGDAPAAGTAADFAPFHGYNQLSRFKFVDGTDGTGTIDLASEQKIMQVNTDRGRCCHVGGEIDFDGAGNLVMSTGDDTDPFESDGYTPIDERADRNPAFDAQRTSGNTNDLRGKVLRITVGEDGSYTIPEGNLFPPGTDKTRPEIYAMGFRNPFRIAVDKQTGWIYLGNYGPDAGAADPARGPGGTVEFDILKGPGNYGWPYCVGDNQPFVDYDFATGTSGQPFDCAHPQNNSPHNTGLVDLPPAIAAWIPYDGGSVPEFGTGGESPMGGPVYHFDPNLDSTTKFPEYYDGKNFAYEWDRGWIHTIEVGPNGERGAIEPFFDSMTLTRPMNIEFGPDGSLYVLDYGSGYFGGAADSAVYRIDYTKGNRTPQVSLSADKTSGPAPLTVNFDPAGTTDEDGGDLSYAWDFDGDGTTDSTEEGPVSHTYDTPGQYSAKLSVTDPTGLTGAASVVVTAGNTAPTVTLATPVDGGFFAFGDQVPFTVTVTDPEDGTIDCSKVTVEYILGHDNHGHPLSRATGCEGTIATPADEGHGADANVFGVIHASYTDTGSGDAPPLLGQDEAVLQPKLKQAEFFTEQNGVQIVTADGASGGKRVGYIDPGDWIKFDPVNLTGVDAIGYRVSAGGPGGTITVHKNAVDGPVVQTVTVPPTGSPDTYVDLAPAPITDPGGTGPLYLVFNGNGGGLFDVDNIQVEGPGVVGGGGPAQCTPFTPDEGYTALFDGSAASLANWTHSGPGSVELQDDCTLRTFGGLGLLSYKDEFNAYSLKLDWKVAGDDNSGVFVGYPAVGEDPWVAVNQGYEIQIDATDAPDRTTGSVYSFQSADIPARDAALKPPGQWNSYEIVVQGQTIKVYLNGALVNSFVNSDPARDLLQGFVGLQNHGDGDDVFFRNVQIKELVDDAAPVTTATFEPPASGDWHPGTVPVTLTAADDGQGVNFVEYKLDSGQWTRYTGAVNVTGDGEHTLQYHAVDLAGNSEALKAATIKIDGTKPTLMVAGIADGVIYGDATDVVLTWHAEDATSGVTSVTGSLDDEPVTTGRALSLYSLPLGTHKLAVRAKDAAGNVTSQSLTFATTTSTRDLSQLLTRFRASNRLSLSTYKQLNQLLTKIRNAEANGNDEKAARFLGTFVTLVTDSTVVGDADVAAVLERDATAVIDSINGAAVLPQAVNAR